MLEVIRGMVAAVQLQGVRERGVVFIFDVIDFHLRFSLCRRSVGINLRVRSRFDHVSVHGAGATDNLNTIARSDARSEVDGCAGGNDDRAR